MTSLIVPILILFAITSSYAQTTPDRKCMDCMCQVESNCQPLGCAMDAGSLSCGYYQIKNPYWTDCGKPGASLEACGRDKSCSENCVNAYMTRYTQRCVNNYFGSRTPTCQDHAKVHNGGPNGCGITATNAYWTKVSACYGSG